MEIKNNLKQDNIKFNIEESNDNLTQNGNQISEIMSDIKNLDIKNDNNESNLVFEIDSFQDIKWLTGC